LRNLIKSSTISLLIMKIKLSAGFRLKLAKQVKYIARDKPEASWNFKTELLNEIRRIPNFPYSYRKSIFFNDDNIRDLVYKGTVISFRIVKSGNSIEVFGFSKYKDQPIKWVERCLEFVVQIFALCRLAFIIKGDEVKEWGSDVVMIWCYGHSPRSPEVSRGVSLVFDLFF